jgi:hypothetical protein
MKNPNERTSWRHSDGKGMGQKLTARNRNEIRIRTQRSLCDRYDMRRAMVRSRDGPDGGTQGFLGGAMWHAIWRRVALACRLKR